MEKAEFNDWWADFCARFPGKSRGFDNPATLRTWFEILQESDHQAALAASAALQSGEMEFPASWDRIPVVVRDRAEMVEVNWRLSEARRRTQHYGGSNDTGPRACVCVGTGLVLVCDISEVRTYEQTGDWLDDQDIPVVRSRRGVPCSCRRGDGLAVHVQRGRKGKTVLTNRPRYDPEQFCLWPHTGDRQRVVDAWLDQRRPRVAAFDDWNGGGDE